MRKYIFPLIVFLIGFYLIGLRLVGFDFDGIPGDMGDGRLNNYFLEQGYLYLSGNINSYWNAPFFYPEKTTMSISDNLFGTLPLYALFRALSFDRETAYQIWFLSLLTLNFFSCFICIKKLKISGPAAAVGAYIFAFSLPVAGGLTHIQMFPKFAFPIIIYCLIKLIQDKSPKYLFFFLFFTVYQIYCGIYLGFMSMIASVIVFLVMTISMGFKREMKLMWKFAKVHKIKTCIALIINISLLFLLLRPYIVRSFESNKDYFYLTGGLPTLASYFFPTKDTLLYEWLRPLGRSLNNAHEHTLFMGTVFVVAIILSIYLIGTKKNKEIKIWLLSFLVLIIITLNIYHSASLYVIICVIPGFQAIRAVSRIVQTELFFLAGMVAILINYYVKDSFSKTKKAVLIALIFSLIILDQFVFKEGLNSFSKKEDQQRIALLKEKIVQMDLKKVDAFAYLSSNHFEVYKLHIDAMIVSQELKIPTINGYSTDPPIQYKEFFLHPNQENLEITIKSAGIENRKILEVRDSSIFPIQ